MSGIGLLNEKPLHASLKQWHARPGDRFEVLLSHPNFSLEVLLIREEELRRYDGKRKRWRRRGWVTEGRRLVEVLDRRVFGNSADWLAFVPDELQSFTTKDLATVADTNRELEQKMAYCLREAKMIELIGRQGRANLYRVANGQSNLE